MRDEWRNIDFAGKDRAKLPDQGIGRGALQQITMHTSRERGENIFARLGCAEHNDSQIGAVPADDLQASRLRKSGHTKVEYAELEIWLIEEPQSFLEVFRVKDFLSPEAFAQN